MDFTLPEELKMIQESVQDFVRTEIDPVFKQYEEQKTFPREIIKKMGDTGFFGAAFPEEVGGSNLGFLAVAVISEEIARLAPSFSTAMNMQAMTCPFTIFNWGSKQQVDKYVPNLISGNTIGMFALTETGGGSDAAGAMKTTAKRDGDFYILNGSKIFITWANECDTGVLLAKTNPSAGYKGISAFILEPKKMPGFTAHPIEMSNLSPALSTCTAFLDNVKVPAENLIGIENEGFKIAMNALEFGRLTVSARLVGLAQACLDQAINYAKERIVGGQAIGKYQMVQQLIADMTVNVEAARLMVYRTGWLMDQGLQPNRAASQAKYFASLAARHAGHAVQEIFGGYALTKDYPISRLNGYIDMLYVGEGAPNVQRILIAEDTLGFKDANRHPVHNRAILVKGD